MEFGFAKMNPLSVSVVELTKTPIKMRMIAKCTMVLPHKRVELFFALRLRTRTKLYAMVKPATSIRGSPKLASGFGVGCPSHAKMTPTHNTVRISSKYFFTPMYALALQPAKAATKASVKGKHHLL